MRRPDIAKYSHLRSTTRKSAVRSVIGYAGYINEHRVDLELVVELARRHPEIMHRIRKIAETRTLADEAVRGEGRKRKSGTPT